MALTDESGKGQIFQIKVQGQLDESWSNWFIGLTIILEGAEDSPQIAFSTFVGSGTRYLSEGGRKAIEELFTSSFS